MKIQKSWTQNNIALRLAKTSDAEKYYAQNFCPLDKHVVRFTGSKENFTKQEVISFFHKSLTDTDRYLFLIISEENDIIGEAVISEINTTVRSAHFRIAIFNSQYRGKGIGSWVTRKIRDFVFEDLQLNRLELEVYSFNTKAQTLYLKAGFKTEGILRETIIDNGVFADTIIMSILKKEWLTIKENKAH